MDDASFLSRQFEKLVEGRRQAYCKAGFSGAGVMCLEIQYLWPWRKRKQELVTRIDTEKSTECGCS